MINANETTEVVDVMAKKWTIEVMIKLESGPRRYNELLKGLDQRITPKVFTRVLRRLEAERIVRRMMVNGSPPGVEYGLTDFGRSMLSALDALTRLWAMRKAVG